MKRFKSWSSNKCVPRKKSMSSYAEAKTLVQNNVTWDLGSFTKFNWHYSLAHSQHNEEEHPGCSRAKRKVGWEEKITLVGKLWRQCLTSKMPHIVYNSLSVFLEKAVEPASGGYLIWKVQIFIVPWGNICAWNKQDLLTFTAFTLHS